MDNGAPQNGAVHKDGMENQRGYHLAVVLMLSLIALASVDLWNQYNEYTKGTWFNAYRRAALADDQFWQTAYRTENLEIKLETQMSRLTEVRKGLHSLLPKMKIDMENLRGNTHDFKHTRSARITMHNLQNNDTEIYRISCGTGDDAPLLRVGLNDFRTDARDSCDVFTDWNAAPALPKEEADTDSSTERKSKTSKYNPERIVPHAFFEKVPLGEGAFGLRPLSGRGNFLSMVPPNSHANSLYDWQGSGPWRVVMGGPIAGQQERFRMNGDFLYSAALEGYLQCNANQQVHGEPSLSAWSASKFRMQRISDKDVRYAQEVVSLSEQILDTQRSYISEHQAPLQAQKAAVHSATSGSSSGLDSGSAAASDSSQAQAQTQTPIHICIGVPMTSKGTEMDGVRDSPLWSNLFDSFMKSIDWRSNKYVFKFFLGFDLGDEIYDTGDAWNEIRTIFANRARYRLEETLLEASLVTSILENNLHIEIKHYQHLQGAPTQVVSQLMMAGYSENYDYFYQVNDDTIIETPNWPARFITALAGNPSIPNFGVTGPLDTNNDKIFTHSFVHRTHMDVFNFYFPVSFKNWWSDDWISSIYGAEHTFRLDDVKIKHNVGAQKTSGATQRYEVDHGAQLRLDGELRKSFTLIDAWLKKNSYPRLPLPAVCGFIPASRYLYKYIKHESYNEAHSKQHHVEEL